MKTNLFWMVGSLLLVGCPGDDGSTADEGTGSETSATMSGTASGTMSTSTTTPSTDSMSGTETGDPPGTDTGVVTGDTGDTGVPTGTDTGAATGTTGTDTGADTGAGACTDYEDEKTCMGDKACQWLGQGGQGICIDPEDPPCAKFPMNVCAQIEGCVLNDDGDCVPE
jgi:hypothetical protein